MVHRIVVNEIHQRYDDLGVVVAPSAERLALSIVVRESGRSRLTRWLADFRVARTGDTVGKLCRMLWEDVSASRASFHCVIRAPIEEAYKLLHSDPECLASRVREVDDGCSVLGSVSSLDGLDAIVSKLWDRSWSFVIGLDAEGTWLQHVDREDGEPIQLCSGVASALVMDGERDAVVVCLPRHVGPEVWRKRLERLA